LSFLQLADEGKAEYLLTGDRDLLSIDGRFGYPIITEIIFLI
jgi:predicted nucleic acid-binding protein